MKYFTHLLSFTIQLFELHRLLIFTIAIVWILPYAVFFEYLTFFFIFVIHCIHYCILYTAMTSVCRQKNYFFHKFFSIFEMKISCWLQYTFIVLM